MTDLSLGEKAKLLRRVTYASVAVAIILVLAKFAAWFLTHSVSLLSTLMDSILDTGASLITLVAVHHAMQPADEDHRFGHGKAEALAALLQALLIGASALWLLGEVYDRFQNPVEIHSIGLGLAVIGLAIFLTLLLLRYQKKVIALTGSMAIAADSMHYQTDLWINLSVVIGLILSGFFQTSLIDVVLGGGIALYILKTAFMIGRNSFDVLMDRELSENARELIIEHILAHPAVVGLHDLRTRSAGHQQFIQCHVEINGNLSLYEAHEVSEELIKSISQEFPAAEVLIHLDPPSDAKRVY